MAQRLDTDTQAAERDAEAVLESEAPITRRSLANPRVVDAAYTVAQEERGAVIGFIRRC